MTISCQQGARSFQLGNGTQRAGAPLSTSRAWCKRTRRHAAALLLLNLLTFVPTLAGPLKLGTDPTSLTEALGKKPTQQQLLSQPRRNGEVGARRRRTSRAAQRDEGTGGNKLGTGALVGIILACTIGGGCIVVGGCIFCRRNRRVGAAMTTVTETGQVVQIRGAGKAMRREDFEAKIGTMGFDRADKDNSGSISKKEWMLLFEEVDKDGDGTVTQREWEAVFGPGTFDAWDKNGDGTIDAREWKAIYISKKGAGGKRKSLLQTVQYGGAGGNVKQAVPTWAMQKYDPNAKAGTSNPASVPPWEKKTRGAAESSHIPGSNGGRKKQRMSDVVVTDM